MINSKISELTELTSADNADLLVSVDTSDTTDASSGTTKRITWTNVKAFLKTYFDGLYDAIGAATTAVSNHAALLTGIHGLAITAGKTITATDNTTLGGGSHSGTNTGDNATNSQYSGLASSKADVAQTMNIGTTAVAINRASAALALTGITSIDGLSATATKLATARLINGASFDGSANVDINFSEGQMQNGKIVPSVASDNLTVALKTTAGNDPSASDPVKVMIGGVVRTITGALSVTKNAATNWCNAGSAELATKELDYFAYIGYNATDGVVIGFSRIPFATLYSDFSTTTTNEKYAGISTIANAAAGDNYVNIGRFAATLSAGAGYTWSVPTFTVSNLIQRPIYETRTLTYTPQFTNAVLSGYNAAVYKILNTGIRIGFNAENRTFSSGSGAATISIPMAVSETIPNVIYILGNSSTRANNTYMAQLSGGVINFWQGNDFTGFAGSETAVYLKYDNVLPLI